MALATARRSIIHDPGDAVVRVLQHRHGLDTDPVEERGYKGPWYSCQPAIESGIAILVHGFGWTQEAAARRMGYSASKAYRVGDMPFDVDDLDLFEEAEALIGTAP